MHLPKYYSRHLKIALLLAMLSAMCACSKGAKSVNGSQPSEVTPVPKSDCAASIFNCYKKVAMHLHGLSNHNGSGMPASMQLVSSEVSSNKAAEILWWNDHSGMFDQTKDGVLRIDEFKIGDDGNLYRDQSTTNLSEVSHLRKSDNDNVLTSNLTNYGDTISLKIQSNGKSNWAETKIRYLTHENQTIKGFHWVKPLTSCVSAELDADFLGNINNVQFSLVIKLSWHQNGSEPAPQTLNFNFGGVPNLVISQSGFNAIIDIPFNKEGIYTLDITNYASMLVDGRDNVISEISWIIRARSGESAELKLNSFKLISSCATKEHQLSEIEDISAKYEIEFGLPEFVGVEYGGRGAHLNAYCPTNLSTLELLDDVSGIHPQGWVDKAHSENCLVSYNHPFGTSSGYHNLLSDTERDLKMESMSKELFQNRLFGSDLFEVGYLARGGLDLFDHLLLWDYLNQQGIFTVPLGVTDTHGGRWHANMLPNPFATWVLAESNNRENILQALTNGHVYFGNPFYLSSDIIIQVGDNLPPGKYRASNQPIKISIESNNDYEVYLVQAPINIDGEAFPPVYEKDRIKVAGQFELDISTQSFFRFEIYKGSDPHSERGKPVLFSAAYIFE